MLVPSARFERAAYGLGGRCSIQLSYEGAFIHRGSNALLLAAALVDSHRHPAFCNGLELNTRLSACQVLGLGKMTSSHAASWNLLISRG